MAKAKKIWVNLASAGAALLLGISGLGYAWLHSSLPALDGERRLPQLAAPAAVATDLHGIPSIHAASRTDAVRVLGYVTARDRLFQMDLMRRKNAGRLAEVFGDKAFDSDKQARIYGFKLRAGRVFAALPVTHREYLQAYADGVNSYLMQARVLPFEFGALGYSPELWQAEDCLLMMFGMFETLTARAEQSERMLSVMQRSLPAAAVAFFTPDTDRYTDQLLQAGASLRPSQPVPAAILQPLLAQTGSVGPQLADAAAGESLAGSNAWAVSGRKTADGRAILANDMHLSINVPNIWYRIELAYPGVEAVGVNLPGTPFLIAGSNRYLAWGVTNLGGDFLDLVQLETDPEHAGQYRDGDGWRAFEQRRETIRIKGGGERELVVRETRWGPVADKPLLGRPVAIRWAALDTEAVNTEWLELEQSQNLEQALAIANRAGVPQLNVLFADNSGRIAWTLTGKIPLRFGGDGSVSTSWADGNTGWSGYLPPERMPRNLDPTQGFLASANERRFGADYPVVIGHQFANGYRAFRISQKLRQTALHDEWSLFNLQLDTESEFFGYYRQLALHALNGIDPAAQAETAAIRAYLLAWNGRADADSLGLPLLVEFRKQLIEAVIPPFLAACKQADPEFSYAWNYVDTPLQALLSAADPALLPDAARYRDWDDFVAAQLQAAAGKLLARNPGKKLADLTWGSQNRAAYAHPFSKAMPFLAAFLNMPEQTLAGCTGYCVRVAGANFAASERLVVSPGHWQDGILHMPGGQSGHPLSEFYMDQQPYWLQGVPLALQAGDAEYRWTLKP
ncbi:penicillin acylase family protein [Methylomonas sp. EFPC3]|uniref:penicillin acylase family protein n=1 Tax=Methylomonas sp. EFPC3 TaxID=3021710 RepID=UPI0024164EBE|nr:penicillin acylase family protein [Methylomonas sp. EFPC3]WFP49599.1 penicillin acylase family protein [Methylomonas sp. EFPC3]